MKRPRKGEWTDISEHVQGALFPAPLKVVYRGERGLYFVLWRSSPTQKWILRCDRFDILAAELEHTELAPAQSQAVNLIRRALLGIENDLNLAHRKIT